MSKYLKFEPIPFKGKTKKFSVVSKSSGDILGIVQWYSRWRQYTFHPYPTIWNKDCLNDISSFLKSLMDERKNNRTIKPSNNLNDKQKETFNMLISKGATHHKEDGLDNCVWFLGRYLLIAKDGTYEDL